MIAAFLRFVNNTHIQWLGVPGIKYRRPHESRSRSDLVREGACPLLYAMHKSG